ncbi:TPA: hypothetical protein IHD35_000576 [Escherichia coli]|nr:hypothetical protein [Escherichia coli]
MVESRHLVISKENHHDWQNYQKHIPLFCNALFAVLALSAIDNQMEQKAWNKYKNEHECFISDTEKRDDNYNNPKNLATYHPAT